MTNRWHKRDSMLYGPFALAAGRTIRNGSGIHIATVHRVGSDSHGYALTPADADDLARRIVDALNQPQPVTLHDVMAAKIHDEQEGKS